MKEVEKSVVEGPYRFERGVSGGVPEGYLLIGAAADYVQRSTQTLRLWGKRGFLEEHWTRGNKRCYRKEDLDACMETCRNHGGRAPTTVGTLSKRESPVGLKFGQLTIVEQVSPPQELVRTYRCVCECGKTLEAALGSIKKGYYRSCGGPNCLPPLREYKKRGRPPGSVNKPREEDIPGVVIGAPRRKPGRPATGRKPRDPRPVAHTRAEHKGNAEVCAYLDKLSRAYSKVPLDKVHAWLKECCERDGKDFNLVVLKLRQGAFQVEVDEKLDKTVSDG